MRTCGIIVVLALTGGLVMTVRQPAPTMAAAPGTSPTPMQTPASPSNLEVTNTFSSAADVQALLAKAKAERKEGQVVSSEHILSLSPYNANLEYRPVDGAVAVHEKEAEMVYVLEGTGTLTTGGKVVGEKRTNATNLSGTAIDGGSVQPLAKGDFAIIPENTPHQFKPVNGALVLMTLHVPRPVPAAQ